MKALGEAAIELPWACPAAPSLAAIARWGIASWEAVRGDPGAVLLLVRDAPSEAAFALPPERLRPLLVFALRHLRDGIADWNLPGPRQVAERCRRQAALASALAERAGGIPVWQAWTGGLLAPLGWIAAAVVDPVGLESDLHRMDVSVPCDWQRLRWGLDHASVARRLARCWRLPTWLASVVGNLGLHAGIAESLGAEPRLFRTIQAASLLASREGFGLGLAVGDALDALLADLGLDADEAARLARTVAGRPSDSPPWESPASASCLADLLHWRLDALDGDCSSIVERLHQDVDRLHVALERQASDEKERLHGMKLAALAELAAGAGHEINNPLAVISGQAQYLLKQVESAEEQLQEDLEAAEAFAPYQRRIAVALQKIVGQTQRIHHVLTDLMQFARPGLPRLQRFALPKLLGEVAAGLQSLAAERSVRLLPAEIALGLHLQADPQQLRTALANLVRNAVEAAPPDGFVAVRVRLIESGGIEIAIEDNGAGLDAEAREHLFDPFYCGRSAGRGRGLGLPAAWRLVRQHGGDVRFDPSAKDVTRFVVFLPAYEMLESAPAEPVLRIRQPELV